MEPVEEFHLCAAQRDLCDRDLGLIFMHWPGPHSPLLPVALAQPTWQREGTQEEKTSHMSERGELVRGRS